MKKKKKKVLIICFANSNFFLEVSTKNEYIEEAKKYTVRLDI